MRLGVRTPQAGVKSQLGVSQISICLCEPQCSHLETGTKKGLYSKCKLLSLVQ